MCRYVRVVCVVFVCVFFSALVRVCACGCMFILYCVDDVSCAYMCAWYCVCVCVCDMCVYVFCFAMGGLHVCVCVMVRGWHACFFFLVFG